MNSNSRPRPTTTHWGNYTITTRNGRVESVDPVVSDSDPSAIGESLRDTQHPGCRVARPSIRQGYLDKQWRSDRRGRGSEPFVEVPWDEALDLVAGAIRRVIDEYGNGAIYGGSYGWASAGRFHHSQSQLHRFLKMAGGYVASVQSYSIGAAQIIMPHVLGSSSVDLTKQAPTIEDIVANTRLLVSFGGISMKNMQINQGGIGNHSARGQLQQLREAGVDVVCVSPIRHDVADFLRADWWPVRPNSDVALMLGLAHTLHSENLHDRAFLDSHCIGYERFARYLTGADDGQPKSAKWAATLCDIDAERIVTLARRMAREPCLMSISWSLQRTEHGEQPYWMITTLAAMLGNLGAPGQGVGYGYGCIHNFGFAGRQALPFKVGELPQGANDVDDFIPVARVADMLLAPGTRYRFNGQTRRYPTIKMIYWAGGNPFHHHQDLNRLRRAWTRPETIVVNEPVWTSTARFSDIVLPATAALERDDFACGTADIWLSPMHRVLEPWQQARDDYQIFSALAQRLGFVERFTEGRDVSQWLTHLWDVTRERARHSGLSLPDFASFWHGGQFELDRTQIAPQVFTLERFHADPHGAPLGTPSGKVEIYSATLAAMNLPDCLGHPGWLEKTEFIGSQRSHAYPLALNSNQPRSRLHSQYDFGATSVSRKRHGREVASINPRDAAVRGIRDGDIIRLFNDRGACLAAAQLTENVRAGVVMLPTGAWYDPLDPATPGSLDVHGNPNVLTRDVGTSQLAQASSAHSCLVEIEKYAGEAPPVTVFQQPGFFP